jgi:hypothetical protein
MSLTEDFTFQLGTGTVLNSGSTLPFVDITKVTGLDNAEYRTTTRDWEGNEGTFMDAEFEKGRTIVLDGTIYSDGTSMENYLDTLKANYAPSSTLQQFFFKSPGVAERFLLVKPLGLRYDWDTSRRLGIINVQVTVFAEDPRIYDSSQLSYSINLGATVFTGFGFSFGFSFGFGGTSSTSDGVFVTNTGNRPSPPVFTINGPVTNPRILNDTLSREMIFTIDLSSTDTLTVDAKYRTVKLNGTTNRRNTLQSPTWFSMNPGDNFIRYRAESSDPTSSLDINFYPAWR